MQNLVQINRISRSENVQAAVEVHNRITEKILPPQIPMQKMTGLRADNIVTHADEPIPDCVTCGACCQYFVLAPVFKSDEQTSRENYYEVTMDDDGVIIGKYLKRKEDGSCHALGGKIGERVGCEIYETRPNNCRGFDTGCDRCHELRRMYGLEPQLSEEQVAVALEKLDARKHDQDFNQRIVGCQIVREEIEKYSVNFDENGQSVSQMTKAFTYTLYGKLVDETIHEIHSFDPKEEFWTEDEFLGKTLSEAYEHVRNNA